jgi:cbb3-type cytochrome oxidase maturation protein
MSVAIILILASLAVAVVFLGGFIWSVRSGQYEDTLTPAMRMLLDDAPAAKTIPKTGEPAAPFPVAQQNLGAAKTTLK